MLDKLIKFLGGYTKGEYQFLESQNEAFRANCIAVDAQLVQMKEFAQGQIDERKYLQELLFKKAGIIEEQRLTSDYSERPDPIRISKMSARERMSMMQKDDAMRFAAQKVNEEPF